MTIRIAAIEVSHWHAVYDPAYLRQLARMPDVQLVGLQDPDPAVALRRAAEVGDPPTFTDRRRMLDSVAPDFVVALGRHSAMAETALELIERDLPFLMEKPLGLNAAEVARVAAKARERGTFIAVPMPQRFSPFYLQARQMLADGAFGAARARLHAHEPLHQRALPAVGLAVDARPRNRAAAACATSARTVSTCLRCCAAMKTSMSPPRR